MKQPEDQVLMIELEHTGERLAMWRTRDCNGIEELQNPKTTSLSPKNVFQCLRLKLWCTESSKMVGRLTRRKRKAIAAVTAGS